MNEPTAADRATAFECWAGSDPVEAIAAALASERARARTPFLRLLVQLDAFKSRNDLLTSRDTQALAWLAEHVRAAAEASS